MARGTAGWRVTRGAMAVVLLFLSAACGVARRGRDAPAPLRPPLRDSLLAADAARGEAATRLGLAAAAPAWLDPSVVYLRGGAPVLYGRDAAQSVIGIGMPDVDAATYRWEPLGGGIARDGRSGYTYGLGIVVVHSGQVSGSRSPGPAVRVDHYLAFWRRGADGVWRIAAYAEVGGPAVPAEAALPPVGFAPTLSLPRGRRADAVRQVREADSAFALAADLQGTGIAFSAFVAPQGVLFSGSEVVTGPEAVRALLEAQQRRGSTLNWRPVYADAADSGDLGMTVGESVIMGRTEATGSVFQRFGKYLTIWQRQPNGSWRFVVDGGNLSPTPAR